jgi:adenylate kinase
VKNYKVVYLTGAPATGKSTLSERLKEDVPNVRLFTYSKELARCVSRKTGAEYAQIDMRRESARVITPADVEETDRLLLDFVAENREVSHIVIDSHAVTKENYGFRVTPFSSEMLCQIRPDMIVSLYTDSETAIRRITSDAQGRPVPTPFQADCHTNFQASVAITYSISLGKPVHFLDSNTDVANLVQWFADRLNAKKG